MQNYDLYIGANIREVRMEKGLSQQKVADKCGFANTVLSAYENGKKIPSLATIATIARVLEVNIERLYYGDDDTAFFSTVPDEGRRIVNAIYLLWDLGVLYYSEDDNYAVNAFPHLMMKYPVPIKRLINGLNEFQKNKETYEEPTVYLEMLFSSVAREINIAKEAEEKLLQEKKQAIYKMANMSR